MQSLGQLPLLPRPRRVTSADGVLRLGVAKNASGEDRRRRCGALHAGRPSEASGGDRLSPRSIASAPKMGPSDPDIPIECSADSPGIPAQGYRMTIAARGVRIEAADTAGAFYGRMTLRQLARLCPDAIPCGAIEDAPDIPIRGVMLDISRDKVPTMDTLFLLADMLAEWKINHLELYMEHTFAYRNHREVWAEASPLTAGEVRALDAYCRQRCIELAPNQNSFGHFERWLKHARYRPLAECPDGFARPDGSWRAATTLDPTNPDSLALLEELYAELLPNFTSRRMHIGCDETWELGKGRSRPSVERLGLHRVYYDYLGRLKALAASHGRTALYWGDMVWNHFPDRVGLLDREMTHVDWGYYRLYPYREHGEKLAFLSQLGSHGKAVRGGRRGWPHPSCPLRARRSRRRRRTR